MMSIRADVTNPLPSSLFHLLVWVIAAIVAIMVWLSFDHIGDLLESPPDVTETLAQLVRDHDHLVRAFEQGSDQSTLQLLNFQYQSSTNKLRNTRHTDDGLRDDASQDAISLILRSADQTSTLLSSITNTTDYSLLQQHLRTDENSIETVANDLIAKSRIASIGVRRGHAYHVIYSMSTLVFTSLLLVILIYLNNRERSRSADVIKANERLEDLRRQASQFQSHMNHEIRTPLNGIIGTIQLVDPSSFSSSNRELFNTLKHSSSLLLGVVNDFLDSAKIEAGEFSVSSHSFDVREFAADVISQNAGRFNNKNVDFLVRIDETLPRLIQGDRLRLEQIMSNLISNAVKFTERGSVLFEVQRADGLLQTKNSGDTIAFIVSDTGIGIREEDQKTLFAPFKQVDNSLTRQHIGTGLGLSIIRKLVEKMGGVISLQSKFGEGTSIRFDLPHAIVIEPESRVDIRNVYANNNCKVAMFGENSTIFRASLLLNQLGVSVGVFRTGADAEAILRTPPDSLVTIIVDRSFCGDAIVWLNQIVEQYNHDVDVGIIVFHGARSFRTVESRLKIHEIMGQLTCSGFLEVLREAAPSIEVDYRNSKTEAKAETEQVPAAIRKASVLVVDDNSINRQVLVRILANLDVKDVATASDANEAIDHLEKRPFDIVLMDIQMPDIDGYMATKMIREKGYKDVRIFACSAHALESDVRRSLNEGLDGHISKPVVSSELLALLKRAVLSS